MTATQNRHTQLNRFTPEQSHPPQYQTGICGGCFLISFDAYTNLPIDSFPPEKIKFLYSLRWGIETSFRFLKYSLGLLYFHSKKPEFILQEIFAKLTMYNFSQLIAASVSIRKASKKLIYRINFSAATNVCRKFFLSLCTPDFVEAVIQKNILPIRSLKGKPRSLKSKPAVSFLYRVA